MARTDREGANPTTLGQAPRMPAGFGGAQGEAASGPVGEALTSRELLLVDALAERVLMLLEPVLDGADASPPSHLVDARMLSRQLGVSRDTVYEHAEALGGRRIGNGPRGRLRFDLDVALAAWTHRSGRRDSTAPESFPLQPEPARAASGVRAATRDCCPYTSRPRCPAIAAANGPDRARRCPEVCGAAPANADAKPGEDVVRARATDWRRVLVPSLRRPQRNLLSARG
jgi:hypothetical protein